MREPNRASTYALLYMGLLDIAKANGYTLALHGSMLTDLDLIAVPWFESAISPYELVEKISNHLKVLDVNPEFNGEPEEKPFGRLSWMIHLEYGGSVDLSIIPKNNLASAWKTIQSEVESPEGDIYTFINVVPNFGSEHVLSPDCWCNPEHDKDEWHVLIHKHDFKIVKQLPREESL